jgi:ABC-type transporter MlaC component
MKPTIWTPTLRALALALALLPAVRLAAQPGAASAAFQDTDGRGPQQTVQATIEAVMDAIRKDPAARAGDIERTYRIVQQRFLPNTDFMLTTQYAVGQAWTQATPAQRAALFAQFQTLLARTYALQLTQLQGEHTQFSYPAPPKLAPGATDAIVHTIVVAGNDRMPIDYRMRKTPAGWKIYDINMMGAWMIQVYRQQFAGRLAAGGVDGLVKYLAAHNRTG